MDKPLVSVICLCFNHEKYIKQAIESVLCQTYENVELIVVDDASADDSRSIIESMSKIHGFKTHFNSSNLGNCKAFNIGLSQSKGNYMIDLAADDLLLPERIQVGADSLEEKGETYGVHFCDVELLTENGESSGTHFKRNNQGTLIENVPGGDIYKHLVERCLISAPSMMMRKNVLEELNGYDETLSYEDFDFWVRSARNYRYAFSDQILVKKRLLDRSLSSAQRQRKNKHLLSTAMVCKKILKLNKTAEENRALLKRLNYELKWALITENWEASRLFIQLKEKIENNSGRIWLEKLILKTKPPWYPLLKMVF